jgi:hypothetical protein
MSPLVTLAALWATVKPRMMNKEPSVERVLLGKPKYSEKTRFVHHKSHMA